jgi:hypothetical protein
MRRQATLTLNQRVAGSSPAAPTKLSQTFQHLTNLHLGGLQGGLHSGLHSSAEPGARVCS